MVFSISVPKKEKAMKKFIIPWYMGSPPHLINLETTLYLLMEGCLCTPVLKRMRYIWFLYRLIVDGERIDGS
jgi:hypothetical protein